MRKLKEHLVQFLKKEGGPTAVEYAVMVALLALIVLICLWTIQFTGKKASTATFSSSRGPALSYS